MIIGAPIRGVALGLMFLRDSITINDAFYNELQAQISDKSWPQTAPSTSRHGKSDTLQTTHCACRISE
jgi:hypothetical protein